LRLSRAAHAYDRGADISGRRLALPLLSMFHDTEQRPSLLSSRGLKDVWIQSGVSGVPSIIEDLHHGCGRFVRLENDQPGMVADLSDSFIESLPRDVWWNQVIWRGKEGGALTRRTLVLCVAGSRGLIDVDSKSKQAYAAFRTLGLTGCDSKVLGVYSSSELDLAIELVYIREIAHEVLCSPWNKLVGVEVSPLSYQSPSSAAAFSFQSNLRAGLEENYYQPY
jgi:hypothetical protein